MRSAASAAGHASLASMRRSMPAPTRLRTDRSRAASSWPAMPTFTFSWRKPYSRMAHAASRSFNPFEEVMTPL